MNDKDIQLYTHKQLSNIYNYVDEIIDSLPDKALDELLSGYQNDTDALIEEITRQTNFVINHNSSKIDSESLGYLKELEYAFDAQLKKLSLNYFAATVPSNFTHGWRTLEWGNLLQLNPWSSYLCQRGSGKCQSPDTEVVMFDGTLKRSDEVKVGDLLMGVDSSSRKVLHIHTGEDKMYEVQQTQMENYTVNSEHLLHLIKKDVVRQKGGDGKWKYTHTEHKKINISAKDFYNKSKTFQGLCCGYRANGWELLKKDQKIEPYFLGLWIGDGTGVNQNITNIDPEPIKYLYDYAERLGGLYEISKRGITYKIKIKKRGRGILNPFIELMKEYNILGNKHIPNDYMYSSKQQRLELLAGILDADGHYNLKKNSYELTFKDEELLKQTQKLCWSLGFRCNLHKKISKLTYREEPYTSYRVFISGNIYKIPCKIKRKKAVKSKCVRDPQKSKVKLIKKGVGKYVGFTVDKDNLFLLKDGTVVHNSYFFCYIVPLWRLYTYDPPNFLQQDTVDNKNRKETAIITNENRLGGLHIAKVTEEIRNNDILKQKLNKSGKILGKEGVTTDTGSMLHLRSFGSMIRGLHVGMSLTDDFLNKSALYSKEQRDKFHEVFYAETMNIVEPGGFNLVSGTPFTIDDLYGDLKKDHRFKVFEYPGIFPDGKILAPDRFSYHYLMDMKKTLGSIVFSREILVTPISDGSSLFPWEYLNKSFIGMENINFTVNKDSFPVKMKKIVVGCDFAVSGGIGADYTVYATVGLGLDNKYYLMNVWRKRGASHNEQISKMIQLNHDFSPQKIICENNGFQRIIADLARQRGLTNIEEFTTTSKVKKDDLSGLPSLSAMFERGEIKIPYGNEDSKNMAMTVCSEFNSVTYNDDRGKLEASSGHDDIAMSIFFAITHLREHKITPSVFYV